MKKVAIINLRFSKEFLEMIDIAQKEAGFKSRSAFLRYAIINYLANGKNRPESLKKGLNHE